LDSLIKECSYEWDEPEWGFPKGRRDYNEKDMDCALREFEEETGLSKDNVSIVQNIVPIEEIFTGSNYKSYKHKYYMGFINDVTSKSTENYQKSEVSKLEWKYFDDCIQSIRPYNLEKIDLIRKIDRILNEYQLYR
jgi:8-oxo-dGTP pyrophosphatase MutT (NUDIX family)